MFGLKRIRYKQFKLFLKTIVTLFLLFHIFTFGWKRHKIQRESTRAICGNFSNKNPISSLSIDEKCEHYFKTLHELDNDWLVSNFDNEGYPTLDKEKIYNSVSRLRIYGKCFLDNEISTFAATKSEDKNQEKQARADTDTKTDHKEGKDEENSSVGCNEVERRLFPMFSHELPEFKRWDGTELSDIPIMSNYVSIDGKPKTSLIFTEVAHNKAYCFWKALKSKFNGRGIVISAEERHVHDLVRLIKVLRDLRNELPIQVIHKGDLSAAAQDEIIRASRGENKKYPQELWFVNVHRTIESKGHQYFHSYSNKWLATLFNSFDEMVMMDADTVPFISPKEFFSLNSGYEQTGALFFKDRETSETVPDADISFYSQLMPTQTETDFFGIPQLTDFTFKNAFFSPARRARHFMESGVVVMRRTSHLMPLLISVHLQIWKASSEPVHGDKELFWLGQAVAGSESYTFNDFPAAAIGLIEEESEQNGKPRRQVCSIQPAHFSASAASGHHSRLLWVNSGLQTCKVTSWNSDYEKENRLRELYPSVEELKNFYESPLKINGALVPRPSPPYRRSLFNRFFGGRLGSSTIA
ncbi:hypothetical protein NADFUDRAFT_47409, partial [Nadsonia fulvescens var. elongata DSM 6958]